MENNNKIGVEVKLADPDKFLLIKESLTRIGVASKKSKTLTQSVHILHKRGRYYVCHFKRLFELDGKSSTLSKDDIERENMIACLLEDWGLCTIIDKEQVKEKAKVSTVKILPYSQKHEWNLVSKYTIGGH
jgi:hypothetical protein